MRSLSYTPDGSFSEEFLLHSSVVLIVVRSFSYAPHAGFCEEFLSLTLLMLFWWPRSFYDAPHASFSEEFLLHPS